LESEDEDESKHILPSTGASSAHQIIENSLMGINAFPEIGLAW
jgi:hypothetical protein